MLSADVLAGGWTVAGTRWLADRRLSGTPRSPERWTHAITLWLGFSRLFQPRSCGCNSSQCNVYPRFVCFSPAAGRRLSVRRALLVVEQLKRQLAIIHEAQRPVACRWMRAGISVYVLYPRYYSANTQCAKRSGYPWCGAGLRAFRIHNRRTTLWAPPDSNWKKWHVTP